MSTLVLQTAGAALGSVFGPVGTAVGRAAGALIGNTIDRSLFGEDRLIEGARLSDLQVQESREGAPVPRVFGRARLSGQIIWATDFEEVTSEQEQGGKGGGPTTTTRSFSYFANFAVGLCEGEISHIARIWADGELLDSSTLTHRIYRGDETQQPDSLIVAKQGAGNAPAYRGTAYVVFERLPLEAYGNRLPQLTFEVVRAIGELERKVRAVQLIPGASEFIYDNMEVREADGRGGFISHNRHVDYAATDFEASLDELQAVCPSLEHVGLVVSWFGSDLRCGHCEIRPKVEVAQRRIEGADWAVSGIARFNAQLVSRINGAPAFGGTPSDAGVIRTIRALKQRGIKVSFNPFIMMDIAAENNLPDPYNSAGFQPVYPWRGRITAELAPQQVGTSDKTNAVRDEVAAFLGTAQANQFALSSNAVSFTGGTDWGYRRFILHAAHLCKAAGGVDTFLIGSELRGLTWLRDGDGRHPFVEGLVTLANDVSALLGAQTLISYAADWSEYFGYQPSDGSGDVIFHLDPLWASNAVGAIAIDNYMPLADWREGEHHRDAGQAASIYDHAYLQANIAGGEGYEWFYANEQDRRDQNRTPISDGAYNKAWVFRYKDLVNWWSNRHFNRQGGIERSEPTAWVAQSKPIFFNEFGCPAIDKGANQPNVFFDPQSSESAVPYFSSGVRDDAMQRALLEAGLSYWEESANNPLSSLYGEAMVDVSRSYLWAWDIRPFPAFPHFDDIWADSQNWRFGHWLNGRLGGAPLAALIREIVHDYTGLMVDSSAIAETVDGYVISDRVAARNALEVLLETFQIDLVERAGGLVALPRQRKADLLVTKEQLVVVGERPEQSRQREQEAVLPSVLTISYQDIDADYRVVSCSTRRLVGESRRVRDVQLPIVISYDRLLPVSEQWLQSLWLERDRLSFALPLSSLEMEVGDIVVLADGLGGQRALVSRIDDGLERRVETRIVSGRSLSARGTNTSARRSLSLPAQAAGPPLVVVLDLPLLAGDEIAHAPRIAALARPWPGGAPVFVASGETGFAFRQTLERPAAIGALKTPLKAGSVGVFDLASQLEVELEGASLSGVDDLLLFSGRNTLAVQCMNGLWEVLQFANATLIGPDRWLLSRLLRAQAGTEDAMAAGAAPEAQIVLINGAVASLELTRLEAERAINLRIGLAGRELSDRFTTPLVHNTVRRGLRPLSPVHLRARRDPASGDIHLSWIRRTRIDGDLWEVPDVPLGEEGEAYQLDILDDGQMIRRTLSTQAPTFLYPRALFASDFPQMPKNLTIRVAQLSATEGAGTSRTATLSLSI